MLDRYTRAWPAEVRVVARFRDLVERRPDCFERSCLPGHVTASAFVVSADRAAFLLTHHRKLGRWLQLGGHADGDPDVLRVALREAREESGMQVFHLIGPAGRRVADTAGAVPVDLDVHAIPARPGEPGHDHYDVRFLLVAEAGQALSISAESIDLAWFPIEGARELDGRESLSRLWRKARARLGLG
jgi:8-oxo-dGTP pyrophosphatase MutT (NUDIX family)